MNGAYQAYRAAAQTLPKTTQVVKLYDAVINLVIQAKEAIAEERIEDRYKAIEKATQIILGLQTSLDFENGKQIAEILYEFYSAIYSDLNEIQRYNSLPVCDQVLKELKNMRDSWKIIDDQQAGGSEKPVEAFGSAPMMPGEAVAAVQISV